MFSSSQTKFRLVLACLSLFLFLSLSTLILKMICFSVLAQIDF